MLIGGLQKFSLLDYPEHLSAIIFTQGCNFRCHFCYNPMLVEPIQGPGKFNYNTADSHAAENQEGHPYLISEDDLFAFLRSRAGKLDAVVITGGEPTLHSDLPEFITKIRELGFMIKLDTNGTNPEMLSHLLERQLLDYLAMDIKAPAEKYDLVVGAQPDLRKIKESIKIIMESGRPYEFRTTIVPDLLTKEDIAGIGQLIVGAEKWYLQQFKSDTDLVNSSFRGVTPYSSAELADMEKLARQFVKFCQVR
jgi:pyruvate formate lyase activating enzyme